MDLTVPDIIGYPGAVRGRVSDNAPDGTEMYDHIIRTMNIAYINPCEIKSGGGSEIWKALPAFGLFKDYLTAGAGITDIKTWKKNPAGLTVMFQHMSPLSENYSNEFGQNSILAGLSGNQNTNIMDFGQMMGPEGTYEALKSKAGKNGGAAKTAFDTLENLQSKIENKIGNVGGENAKQIAVDIGKAAKKFDHKIDFPKMWRGASFSTSYSLMIRLYNPAPADDNLYGQLIVAPLIALLAFVCPRSEDGRLWTYPFVMKFKVPGRVDLQSAYCSSMSVVKGGDVNDIAWNSRPNIVDINMQIEPVHSVKLFSKEDPLSDAPTLRKEVEFALKKGLDKNLNVDHQMNLTGDVDKGAEAAQNLAETVNPQINQNLSKQTTKPPYVMAAGRALT